MEKPIEMLPTREGRVDYDAEAKAELGGGDLRDSGVGEVVEEEGRIGIGVEKLLERESAVADIVFVDERDFEGGC